MGGIEQVRFQRMEIKERLRTTGSGQKSVFGDRADGSKEATLRLVVGVE